MRTRLTSTSRNEVRVLGGDRDSRIIDLTQYDPAPSQPGPPVPRRAGALHHYGRVGAALVGIDVACLAVALFAAHWLKFRVAPDGTYLWGMAVACVLWVLVFAAQGLYASHHMTGLEEFRRTLSAVGIGIVLVILLSFWSSTYLSRWWVVLTLVIALVLEIGARRIVRRREQRLRNSEAVIVRTLIIGSRDHMTGPLEEFELRGSGYQPIGFIDVSSSDAASDTRSSFELVERLRTAFRNHQPDCVMVTSPTIGTETMVAIMRAARQEGVLVRIYTHLSGIWASRLTAQRIGRHGVALAIKPAHLTRMQRITKRGMDIAVAGLGLIVTSPVLLISAIAIKATSPGPVLFKQERVTDGARVFQMYKLRTMTEPREAPEERPAVDTTVPFFKVKQDPRMTRVGGFLRMWSIDEVPQLFNVLRGDMSLVGPRPLPAEQVAAHVELLGPRHEVRAGITGWWQINGRSDLDTEEAIQMDHFYIENWSPALDAYILLKTVGVLFTRRGAY